MEEIVFSETEMEAAEQLVQLSEDDTLSCSSVTGLSVSGCNTKRHDDVVSSEISEEQNDGVVVRMMNYKNVSDGQRFVKAIRETNIIRRYKKKKFRSLESLYRATKEIDDDVLVDLVAGDYS